MAGPSKIEWTEATWNPIVGCSILTPGCTNCYAMKMAARLEVMGNTKHYSGTTKKIRGNAVWTGKLALAPDSILLEPLRRKKPTTYFVNSMGDLFHEDCPDEWIDRVFAVMALSPQHTFQVLTKRAARMREYLTDPLQHNRMEIVAEAVLPSVGKPFSPKHVLPKVLPNVWLGVSTERQQEANDRIPDLLATPAAVRFISAEPLLGPINLKRIRIAPDHHTMIDALDGYAIADSISGSGQERTMLDWVIVGGESGTDARLMHPDWARSLRDQCKAADVLFFFKQWGEFAPTEIDLSEFLHQRDPRRLGERVVQNDGTFGDFPEHGVTRPVVMRWLGKKSAGRLLDGVEHNDMPGRE